MKDQPSPHPNRACPICGSDRKDVLFEQRFHTVEGAGLMSGYLVVVCADCGLAFADGIPPQEEFDKYYATLSKYESTQDAAHDDARFSLVVKNIQSCGAPPAAKILDVGCSTGRLLHLLKNAGYSDLTGLDPSPACAQSALDNYGIRVLTRTLSQASSLEPYDLVVLLGVLEHVRDLAGVLELLAGLVAEKGFLYIIVPDVARFADVPDAPFQQFSIEHINYFSAHSLRNLMSRWGFSPVFEQQYLEAQSEVATAPTFHGIYTKDPSAAPPREFDTVSETALEAYIDRSTEADVYLHEQIDALVRAQTPLLVWGVGSHTQRLLRSSRLAEANIVAYVDGNPHAQGSRISGIAVIAPEAVHSHPEPILISSWVFMKDIERDIREKYRFGNEIIFLYK